MICQMKNIPDWVNSQIDIAEEKLTWLCNEKWNTKRKEVNFFLKKKTGSSVNCGTTSNDLVYVQLW